MRLLFPFFGISKTVVWVVDARDSCEIDGLAAIWFGVEGCKDPIGVSMFMSSLIPEKVSLGMIGGGGVRIRSSKLFQKVEPPEFLMA